MRVGENLGPVLPGGCRSPPHPQQPQQHQPWQHDAADGEHGQNRQGGINAVMDEPERSDGGSLPVARDNKHGGTDLGEAEDHHDQPGGGNLSLHRGPIDVPLQRRPVAAVDPGGPFQFDPGMAVLVDGGAASQLPILGKGLMERAIKARKHRPMFVIDLAVPRDVEAEVAELSDVFLYSVDDLAKIVDEGRELRSQAVAEAQAIIDSRLAEFAQWLEGRALVPTIRLMREYAEEYRNLELTRAQRALARGEDPATVLESFSRALLNKFLHHPTVALNQAAPEERQELARLLTRLYRMPDKE